jgi:DNA primase
MDLSGVDVFDFLERCGISNPRPASGGSEANFSCPFPGHSHGDENPSAYMNTETTAWFCWGCKRKGNAISFFAEINDVARTAAERFLRETYGIEFNEPQGGSMAAETEARFAERVPPIPPLRPSESWLSTLHFEWGSEPLGEPQHYLIERGFALDTLEHWGVGYDYMSDRLTFPVRDIDGALLGIKSRAWRADQEPKYLILGDRRQARYGFEPYDPSEVVYGLERARDVDEVVICEGELNAWALHQLDVPRPVATGMSYFTHRHAEMIVREARQAIIFYDTDDAGQKGTWGYLNAGGQRTPGIVEQLEPHMPVRVVADHDKDPAQMLQDGEGDRVQALIRSAQSTLAMSTPSV